MVKIELVLVGVAGAAEEIASVVLASTTRG